MEARALKRFVAIHGSVPGFWSSPHRSRGERAIIFGPLRRSHSGSAREPNSFRSARHFRTVERTRANRRAKVDPLRQPRRQKLPSAHPRRRWKEKRIGYSARARYGDLRNGHRLHRVGGTSSNSCPFVSALRKEPAALPINPKGEQAPWQTLESGPER